MERQSQQSHFPAEVDPVGDVQKCRRLQGAVLKDSDSSRLFQDKEPVAVVTRMSDEYRLNEPLREDGSEGDSLRGRLRDLSQRPRRMCRQQQKDGETNADSSLGSEL